ncbi:MAG: aspartate/glutamate racemase family protein [Acidobacteriota bacterium]|nr:aspartate/glutamate racemase family protein [Acidobacteriota bacterium]
MPQTLALIHTSPSLTPLFTALCAKHLPAVQLVHMVDESLIRNTIAAGHLEKRTMRRVIGMVESAVAAGADAVLVTCSSIGAATTLAQQVFDCPVLRIDEAMAELAVTLGSRIGVLATLRTTLEPTCALVRSKAPARGVELVECLCEGAFDAVMAGDTATHDRIVAQQLQQLAAQVEVVVLAQASMARILASLPPNTLPVPVLASPELAVLRVRDVLAQRSAEPMA